MRSKIVYYCEICHRKNIDFSDEDRHVVETHEASHYNLSVDEYREWNALKKEAEQQGCSVMITNNERTRSAFDKACEDLTDFERKHNIKMEI